MIFDSHNRSNGSSRIVVDEALISPQGWIAIDPALYAPSAKSSSERAGDVVPGSGLAGSAERDDEDILDLTIADMTAALLIRSLRKHSSTGASSIPARDIVPIGGSSLRSRTPEQPFEDEPESANDNFSRFALLLVLLLAVVGGYAFTALKADDRRAIEVQPPESALTKITML